MKSIRSHLFVLLLSALGVLCCAGGWGSCLIVRNVILQEFDYSLKTKAHDLFMLTELEHGGHERGGEHGHERERKRESKYEFEFSDKGIPEFERLKHPEYYQIRLPNGEVLRQSPSLSTEFLPLPEKLSAVPTVYKLILPGGLPGRAAVMKAPPLRGEDGKDLDVSSIRAEDAIIVVLARDTVRLNQVFRHLVIGFTLGTLLVLLIMVLAITWVVRSGLRPLDLLAARAVTIQPDALDVRFPLNAMPMELKPIAGQLNALLERMELAFQRERTLTASMAHELYTPIAELRSISEVVLKWPDDPEATSSVAENAHGIALHMQDVVEALLSLSRCDSGQQQVAEESVDIADMLRQQFSAVEQRLCAKEITCPVVEGRMIVRTDPAMLGVVLSNLVRNAAEHVPHDGCIGYRLEEVEGEIRLALSNSAGQLEEDDLPHLFDFLWKKDSSRTGDSHCGLGLTLVQRFCRLLNIRIEATLPESGLFEVTLGIPVRELS
jgi:signal transduction histidine kinase